MKYALWYCTPLKAWYLLDWTDVRYDSDIILTRFACSPYKLSDLSEFTGGFRWDECGGLLLFNKYPQREINRINKARDNYRSIKPILSTR